MSNSVLPPIGIIGFGNMGEALAAGLMKTAPQTVLHIFEHQAEAKAKALVQYKLPVSATLSELLQKSEILILAIKPQDLGPVTQKLAEEGFAQKKKTLISLAAGVKTSWFTSRLGTNQVVRFMPNLAAKVGDSLVGVSPAEGCPDEITNQAVQIAQAAGEAAVVPEKLLGVVTGISGSGIAFVFRFLHAMAMGGVREGMPYSQALAFSLAAADGAVKLLRETAEHPMAFESKVCSPAGTTIEGVRVLEEASMSAAVMDAVSAATRRAVELEN